MRAAPVILGLVLILLGTGWGVAAASPEAAAAAERALGLLRGVAGEYREAFDPDGGLARPIEIEEAALLVAEARDLLPRMGLPADAVGELERSLGTRASRETVDAQVAVLAARITAATGVTARIRPADVPSSERGRALFHENCASCHGQDGRGDGEESRRLGLTPANFTDPVFMRAETPEDFFNVITLGRRRSGMPAWGDALTVQERWDLVRFLWTLGGSAPAASPELEQDCAGCRTDVSASAVALTRQSDAALLASLASGGDADARARFASRSEPERQALVAALRARAFDALADPNAPRAGVARVASDPRPALNEADRLLDAAQTARRSGDAGAAALATDAYMRFEPFERRLGATDPGLVRQIEEGFLRLRQTIRDPAVPPEALTPIVSSLHRDLEEAIRRLEPATGDWVRFAQSAGIILREGFEVVLVVGALLAYVRRSGTPRLVHSIYVGSAVGVAASLATAIVLTTVLRLTPWAGEALEGAAMLLAAGVLFWVSYWLIAKTEADRWQRYIRGKVQSAITSGSTTALGAAAFLAVYREGFETILFYQALFASAPAGDFMVPLGLVAGLVLLAIVYWGLERIGLRVPMHAFFLATGAFLYAMAIVFAGRGVAELQEAGVISLTPVAWAPRLEVLGVFPTVESLAAQSVFLVLLVYAITVTLRRRGSRVETEPAEPTAPRAAQS